MGLARHVNGYQERNGLNPGREESAIPEARAGRFFADVADLFVGYGGQIRAVDATLTNEVGNVRSGSINAEQLVHV